MGDFEVRKIDGKDVFAKEIAHGFYLVDDVFIRFSESMLPLTDDAVRSVVRGKQRDVCPYSLADTGWVVVLTDAEDGIIDEEEFPLSSASENNVVEQRALEVYDEYRIWAKIGG